jgi:hypothetical protein
MDSTLLEKLYRLLIIFELIEHEHAKSMISFFTVL